ncbi:MAG: Kelch repeat-containing protein [Gemmatimonadales bacterium]
MRLLALLLVACSGLAEADPRWSTAAPIPERIQEMHAAVLHGKIYLAGGFDSTDAPTRVAYRYDPAGNAWERIADIPAARHHMPLATVGDTLYAVGGLSGMTFNGESNLWVYRADLNAWQPRASLPVGRGASAVGVVNGELIVVGGMGPTRAHVDSTAIYDPATNTWRHAAPIPTLRDHLTAQAVSGIMYAIGGRPHSPDRNFDIVEAYDPAANTWSARASMPSRRGGLASAVLDGRIHTFGGETSASVFANHEAYDPAENRWTMGPALPTARHGLAAATVNGKIYVIGGGPRAGLAQTSVVEVFTP